MYQSISVRKHKGTTYRKKTQQRPTITTYPTLGKNKHAPYKVILVVSCFGQPSPPKSSCFEQLLPMVRPSCSSGKSHSPRSPYSKSWRPTMRSRRLKVASECYRRRNVQAGVPAFVVVAAVTVAVVVVTVVAAVCAEDTASSV